VIAALFVETNGAYFNIPGIDPWDEARDAKKYSGPYPVIAHPPCQRWGKMWMGSRRICIFMVGYLYRQNTAQK
jgi:hypothetical protein